MSEHIHTIQKLIDDGRLDETDALEMCLSYMPQDTIAEVIEALSNAGFIKEEDNGWCIGKS